MRNFLEKNEFAVLERVASTVYAAVDKCEAPPDLQDQVAAWGGIGVPRFQDTNVSASDVDDLLEIIQTQGGSVFRSVQSDSISLPFSPSPRAKDAHYVACRR